MVDSRRARRRTSARVRRNRTVAAVIAAVLVVGAGTATAVVLVAPSARSAAAPAASTPAPAPTSTPTPTPTPLTPEEQLLATTTDPAACAVSFAGDGIAQPPMLQTQGVLYADLPIPAREGLVFAGWYATAADAAAYAVPARINGSELVSCTDRRISLFGAWKTPEQNVADDVRVPIVMYHQFTASAEGLPPDDPNFWLKANYAYIGDFDAQMSYISSSGFYLPTWDELSAFIDGRLSLPSRSVIVSDDDGDQSWFDLAAPIVDKYKVLATSFMITGARQDPAPNAYVQRRSHTQDMHQAGDNGKGRMVNWTPDQIAADLEASAAALGGAKQVVAYPYGHYNDTAKQGVRQAGYEMARTIDWGYVKIGTDKLALPVIRMNYGNDLNFLIEQIG